MSYGNCLVVHGQMWSNNILHISVSLTTKSHSNSIWNVLSKWTSACWQFWDIANVVYIFHWQKRSALTLEHNTIYGFTLYKCNDKYTNIWQKKKMVITSNHVKTLRKIELELSILTFAVIGTQHNRLNYLLSNLSYLGFSWAWGTGLHWSVCTEETKQAGRAEGEEGGHSGVRGGESTDSSHTCAAGGVFTSDYLFYSEDQTQQGTITNAHCVIIISVHFTTC